MTKQILIIYAATNGVLDSLPVETAGLFEKEMYEYLDTSYPGLGSELVEKGQLDDVMREKINTFLEEFKTRFVDEHGYKPAEAEQAEESAEEAEAAGSESAASGS